MSEPAFLQPTDLTDLPGAEIVLYGLEDLSHGLTSISTLLLEIAAPRLRLAGIEIPEMPTQTLDAEIRLYRLLGKVPEWDAYSQYNAHLRRLSSLCRALEGRARRRE